MINFFLNFPILLAGNEGRSLEIYTDAVEFVISINSLVDLITRVTV